MSGLPPLGVGNRESFRSTSIDEVTAGDQNSNEVNLTELVNDGTYTDILDAIDNEPSKNPQGTVHVIEPGTYQATTEAVVTYNSRSISVAGGVPAMDTGPQSSTTAPVVIEWDGGDNADMITLNDGSGGDTHSVRILGIEFDQTGTQSGVRGIVHDVSGGGRSFNHTIERCKFRTITGRPIDVDGSAIDAFQNDYLFCGVNPGGSGAAGPDVGAIAYVMGGTYRSASADYALRVGRTSQVIGCDISPNSGNTGVLAYEFGAQIQPRDVEGDGGTEVAVEVDGVTGSPQNMVILPEPDNLSKSLVVTDGPVFAWLGDDGTTVEFNGANNDHNGSLVLTDHEPGDISVSGNQNIRIISCTEVSNVGATTLPRGWMGIDNDRDGAGQNALVTKTRDGTAVFWDADGTL